MISELIVIEQYFGRLEAVMTLDELVRVYGAERVRRAIEADQLELRVAFCRLYARLTDKARAQRQEAPVPAH